MQPIVASQLRHVIQIYCAAKRWRWQALADLRRLLHLPRLNAFARLIPPPMSALRARGKMLSAAASASLAIGTICVPQ